MVKIQGQEYNSAGTTNEKGIHGGNRILKSDECNGILDVWGLVLL